MNLQVKIHLNKGIIVLKYSNEHTIASLSPHYNVRWFRQFQHNSVSLDEFSPLQVIPPMHRDIERQKRRSEKLGVCNICQIFQVIFHRLKKIHWDILIPLNTGLVIHFFSILITKPTKEQGKEKVPIEEYFWTSKNLNKNLLKWWILLLCISKIKQHQHICAIHFQYNL